MKIVIIGNILIYFYQSVGSCQVDVICFGLFLIHKQDFIRRKSIGFAPDNKSPFIDNIRKEPILCTYQETPFIVEEKIRHVIEKPGIDSVSYFLVQIVIAESLVASYPDGPFFVITQGMDRFAWFSGE